MNLLLLLLWKKHAISNFVLHYLEKAQVALKCQAPFFTLCLSHVNVNLRQCDQIFETQANVFSNSLGLLFLHVGFQNPTLTSLKTTFNHLPDSERVTRNQGGSRPSECGKIPAEFFRKSVTFCKTYKNQWQKFEHLKFQRLFAKVKNIC